MQALKACAVSLFFCVLWTLAGLFWLGLEQVFTGG